MPTNIYDELDQHAPQADGIAVSLLLALLSTLLVGLTAYGSDCSARLAVIDADLHAQAASRPTLPDDFNTDADRDSETNTQPSSPRQCACGCRIADCDCSSLRASATLRETSTISRRAAEPQSHRSTPSDTRPVVTLYTADGDWCGPCLIEDRKRDPDKLAKRPYRLKIITTDGRDQLHAVGATNYVISGVPAYVWMTHTGVCRVVRTLEALDHFWEPP